jgi:hypothetical protein
MSAEFSQFPSFPKNLSYNLKKLETDSIVKQKLKINSDNSSYRNGNIIRFNLPVGRMIDLRSLVIYAKGTVSATTTNCHFPRGGLHSLIEQFQITANGRNLQTTNCYNYIWNTISDLEGYSSFEQQTKRITELIDPTVKYTADHSGQPNSKIAVSTYTTDTANDTGIYFCANNFLGFANGSVSSINTNDLGAIQISITLAPATCLFCNTMGSDAAAATPTNVSYLLEEVYLTLDTLTFTNSLYYDLVEAQLRGDGLNIGYYDYITIPGTLTNKAGTISLNTQINASSLDQVIATFRQEKYDTIAPLLAYNASGGAGLPNIYKYVSDPSTKLNNSTTSISNNSNIGDGFFNSIYYMRSGNSIVNSSWFINSQPMTNQSPPIEIFNGTLQSLGYNNLDISSGGIHPGCVSLEHFNKYYFADILSLENISGDQTWWISGLDSGGSTIQISYQCNFGTVHSLTQKVYPYIFARVSKLLNVKIGRALELKE